MQREEKRSITRLGPGQVGLWLLKNFHGEANLNSWVSIHACVLAGVAQGPWITATQSWALLGADVDMRLLFCTAMDARPAYIPV